MSKQEKAPKDLKQLRIDAARLIAAGENISVVAGRVGLSRKSLHKWLNRDGMKRLIQKFKDNDVDPAWLESLDDDLMLKIPREQLPSDERAFFDSACDIVGLSKSYQVAK